MPPYGICPPCLAGDHHNCANHTEPNTCGCLCGNEDQPANDD